MLGGNAGDRTIGHGGTSYGPAGAKYRRNINPSSGYVVITACRLRCPPPSVCRFDGDTPRCHCMNGRVFDNAIGQSCDGLCIGIWKFGRN
jgi:hypothetical protein